MTDHDYTATLKWKGKVLKRTTRLPFTLAMLPLNRPHRRWVRWFYWPLRVSK